MSSCKLSENGIAKVEQARMMKGWNRTDKKWVQAAYTSQATLKRFLGGKPVSMSSFVYLCSALGIEEWQDLVDWENDNDSTKVNREPSENSPAQPEPVEPKRALAVSGCFTESQKARVETLVQALKKVMLEADIIISEEPF